MSLAYCCSGGILYFNLPYHAPSFCGCDKIYVVQRVHIPIRMFYVVADLRALHSKHEAFDERVEQIKSIAQEL